MGGAPEGKLIVKGPAGPLRGDLTVPGDKSISHRAAMLGAIAAGRTQVRNFSPGGDCATTLRCMAALGARVSVAGGTGSGAGPRAGSSSTLTIDGAGAGGLREPADVLDCGNSGTTMRLLAGILAGQPFMSVLTGDGSLRSRPMQRVADPLRQMGAQVHGRGGGSLAPLAIIGGGLRGLPGYRMPVASAQVLSCVLLAALFAQGRTAVVEPLPSRDHTERMLRQFGANLSREPQPGGEVRVTLAGPQGLRGASVDVPGDISSAAFWLVAGAIVPGSDVTVRNVGTNPLRSGFLAVLERMGCDISIRPLGAGQAEPAADIRVRAGGLRGTEIIGGEIPSLLDELPALAVAAAMAAGPTVVSGASELRHKETDRIAAIVTNLRALGVEATEGEDGFAVEGTGGRPLRGGAHIATGGDHRIAMAFAIAGLAAEGETKLDDAGCVGISYPGFAAHLCALAGKGTAQE